MLNMFLSSLSAKYGNTCNRIQSSMFKQSRALINYSIQGSKNKWEILLLYSRGLLIIIYLLQGGTRAEVYMELWTIKQVFNCCFITVRRVAVTEEDKETMSRSRLRSASKKSRSLLLCLFMGGWIWKGKATNLSHSIVSCCRSQPWNFVFLVLLHKGFSCGVVGIRTN